MATKKEAEKEFDMQAVLDGIELQAGNKKKPRLKLANTVVADDIVSFGLPAIDAASNAMGHPRGEIMEIFGPESSGKSYTSYKLMSAYQSLGLHACLIDIEYAFWPSWVAKAGVDLSRLVVGRDFESGEQAFLYAQKIAESKQFGIIVIDSIAALLPQSEATASLDQNARVGAHAAMMSRCLRQLKVVCSKSKTTLVCLNQTRTKIGVMFGNPEDTPGGKALKFYSGMRIGLQFMGKEMGKIDGVDKPIGIRTKVKFVKNKIGQPFGEDEFVIYHVDGVNTPMAQMVNLAIRLRIINRKAFDDDDPKAKTFAWKHASGEVEDTTCTTASDLADWFDANDLVKTVVEKIEEKAKDKNVDIPAEVLELKNRPSVVEIED
jgi:recombination protein RecA